MGGGKNATKLLIMDACILIDLFRADRTIFARITQYIGPLHVVAAVLEEVAQIKSPKELEKLGIILVEAELEDAFTAASMQGATSFQDNLCLLTAVRQQFTCVTNDKSLRKRCTDNQVAHLWGLQLLVELHRAGGVTTKHALTLATTIHMNNPRHITASILQAFRVQIEG